MTPARILVVAPEPGEPLDTVPVVRVLHKAGLFEVVERGLGDAVTGVFDAVVVTGGAAAEQPVPRTPLTGLLAAHVRADRRAYTVCSGAFVLAGLGVLRGRTVAGHSGKAERLAAAGGCRVYDGLVRDRALTSAGGRSVGHVKALAVALRIVADLAPQALAGLLDRLDVAADRLPPLVVVA
ncbi:hypothetical protein Cs7R123_48670 [Catellatospora sp. TT07R-123]|uniref:DJ-1/PfpI family protein n=1 Tax=Catellatospora sp. TT07R-123 TaxID=2733863 RepID=UPI001B23A4D7|nr:DJ-1/PfpI family protein [Catellatospora sp. TT07R-123]GHJ47525.1 hypothetical protein Cs7R123_48670 [Catellatospora sp. TT07R-123]